MPPVNRLSPTPANAFVNYGPFGPVTSDPVAAAEIDRPALRGVGTGLANQLRGMYGTAQRMATSRPIDDIRAALASLTAIYKDPAIALQVLRQIRQRASTPEGAGEVLGELLPLPGPKNVLRRGPVMSELDVYHATPHRFEPTATNPLGEFDASKIGTGEGAQAYGHGIYTAESPQTAQSYYDQFKQQIQGSFDTVTDRRLDALMQEFGGDVQKVADRFMASVYDTPKNKAAMRKEVLERLEARTRQPYMLKADLPDEMIDRMLDWDKPLKEQPANVQKFFSAIYKPNDYLVDWLKQGDADDVAKILQEAGIPGIRYLDRSSRIYGKPKFFVENVSADGRVINSFRFDTREEAEKFSATFKKRMKGQLPPEKIGTPRITEREAQQTTSNFVVFPGEEKKVRILERK